MKILIVDDQPDAYFVLEDEFGEQCSDGNITFVKNIDEAMSAVEKNVFDLILMDGNLPEEDFRLIEGRQGPDIVKRMRTMRITTPIIIVSSDKDAQAEGVANGANVSTGKEILFEDGAWENIFALLK